MDESSYARYAHNHQADFGAIALDYAAPGLAIGAFNAHTTLRSDLFGRPFVLRGRSGFDGGDEGSGRTPGAWTRLAIRNIENANDNLALAA